jgi:uncharacterized protein (DUF952 family)
MTPLFHIASAADVAAAMKEGEYRPPAFAREGFVHCSYGHQVQATANRIFRGRRGLVLLEIDPGRLGCEVIAENLEGGAELFPHIYGPVPMTAVVATHAFECGDDGLFVLTL